MHRKSLIPAHFKYRDEGYMYFPCSEILPFLKAVDVKTKEHPNISIFSEFGANLVRTFSDFVENNSELLDISTEPCWQRYLKQCCYHCRGEMAYLQNW